MRSTKYFLITTLLAGIIAGPIAAQDLKQNWTPDIAQRFWTEDQGSMLMRSDIFMRLEKADGNGLLKDDLESFGFIPRTISGTPLPIGISIHADEQKHDWVGLTCSACHTGAWTSKGKTIVVEGAPSMLDFDKFYTAVVMAVRDTCANRAKFDRMAQNSDTTFADFCQKPDSFHNLMEKRFRIDKSPVESGFGRVDAFGAIFNEMVVFGLGNDEKFARQPLAPASYPFLWDIAQHKVVQWNGSAPNLGVGGDGSKLRNIGEVLGVFGHVTVTPGAGLSPAPKYASSVNSAGIAKIESWVTQLYSPDYPAGPEFGTIAADRSARGAELYNGKAQCVGCHQVLSPKSDRSHLEVHLTPADEVRTDRALVDEFRLNRAPSGPLAGKLKLSDPWDLAARFAPVDFIKDMTVNIAMGALGDMPEGFRPSKLESISDGIRAASLGKPDLAVYKARPLNGIWATAPFLHNGSVPNLWELLQWERDRTPAFCTGTRAFDPVNVGYPSVPCTGSGFLFDTTKAGNTNVGHEYGVDLTPDEKRDLIEYLKSL